MISQLSDIPQTTLKKPVRVEGVGLFTGQTTSALIKPARASRGVVFRRIDLPGAPEIAATVENAVDRPRRTSLVQADVSVEMTEHFMSALVGLGVDNVEIDLDGPELPACDGSAAAYADAISSAGIAHLDAPASLLTIDEPITIRDGDAMLAALPPTESTSAEYMYVLDYGASSPIRRQTYTFELNPERYAAEIAPARTFSTRADAEAAQAAGLFRHLSAKDMLVIDESGPLQNEYRFADEPVRHKVLDLMGDLAMVGHRISGRIIAVRSGHSLNLRLARALVGDGRIHSDRSPAHAAMDIRRILSLLPHRYPMVLVDRVLEIEGDRRAVGVKNVTINEPFFQGHYPGSPIMPGVLIVEAMCQLAGLMLSQKLDRTGKIAMLLSLDAVKLRRPVTPGDQLVMETESVKTSTRFGDVQCRAFVAGELAAEARVKFMMVDAEQHA